MNQRLTKGHENAPPSLIPSIKGGKAPLSLMGEGWARGIFVPKLHTKKSAKTYER